jgi:polar amino acid transport system permease protein
MYTNLCLSLPLQKDTRKPPYPSKNTMPQNFANTAIKNRFYFIRSSWADIIKFFLLLILLTWLIYKGTEKIGYHWQWHRVPQFLFSVENGKLIIGPLIHGLIVTLHISGWSILLAAVIGLTASALRMSHSFMGIVIARGYVEIIRNTPLLVQLFFLYFVLAPALGISRFASAVLALSLFEGAYASEIFRAGIVSINKGQWEAAYSLGMGKISAFTYVAFPQAIRRILPPLTNQGISLIKDSALVSTIAMYDLTMQGQIIISETFLTFEIWFTVAAIYLFVTVSLSTLTHSIEKHIRIVE